MKRSDFPSDFVWGTATSAYQIEGAVCEDGRGPSIWDTFSHTPGKTRGGHTGDVACDHYHRYLTDIGLMRSLGLNAYRFSVAWPRIFPQGRGAPNPKGLAFYDRLVDALLESGLEPWLTLYHWDLPQALQDQGGWPQRDTAYAFAEYAAYLSRYLGDRVRHWITLNEPWCSAHLGYYAGVHAPGLRDLALSLQAAHHLLLAHGLAVPLIRENAPKAQVGITLNLAPGHPVSPDPADLAAARRYDGFQNRWYLDPLYGFGYPPDMLELYGPASPHIRSGDLEAIATPTDFLGLNYYTRAVLQHSLEAPYHFSGVRWGQAFTHMDWEVYPDGLRELLVRLAREYRPKAIYITENGAAYPDGLVNGQVSDPERIHYLQAHFAAALQALREGAPLRGYFIWSLLDNFEWAEGYEKRFGLVYVDFATQARYLKDSGHWLGAFLREEVPSA